MESHLLQMRGLKLLNVILFIWPFVASFTDAWIETYQHQHVARAELRRIFYRCVD